MRPHLGSGQSYLQMKSVRDAVCTILIPTVEDGELAQTISAPLNAMDPNADDGDDGLGTDGASSEEEDEQQQEEEEEQLIAAELQRMKVVELKDLLRGRGLPTSGKKVDLVARLTPAKKKKPSRSRSPSADPKPKSE